MDDFLEDIDKIQGGRALGCYHCVVGIVILLEVIMGLANFTLGSVAIAIAAQVDQKTCGSVLVSFLAPYAAFCFFYPFFHWFDLCVNGPKTKKEREKSPLRICKSIVGATIGLFSMSYSGLLVYGYFNTPANCMDLYPNRMFVMFVFWWHIGWISFNFSFVCLVHLIVRCIVA